MKFDKKCLALYAVTDRAWLKDKTLAEVVEESILGGVSIVQLREKNISHDEFVALALEIKDVCQKYKVPFIINDDVDVMLEVDADGIHVGQEDLEASIVRQKIGPNKILGVSAETVSEAILAEKMGADYLGVGAVFPTSTKLDAIDVAKAELNKICSTVSIPVVAIGGITLDNIKELKDSGIDGIAVVSAIYAKENIQESSRKLLEEVKRVLK